MCFTCVILWSCWTLLLWTAPAAQTAPFYTLDIFYVLYSKRWWPGSSGWNYHKTRQDMPCKVGAFPSVVLRLIAIYARLTAWNGRTDTWIYKYRHGKPPDGWWGRKIGPNSLNSAGKVRVRTCECTLLHESWWLATTSSSLHWIYGFSQQNEGLIRLLSDNKNRMPLALHTEHDMPLGTLERLPDSHSTDIVLSTHCSWYSRIIYKIAQTLCQIVSVK